MTVALRVWSRFQERLLRIRSTGAARIGFLCIAVVLAPALRASPVRFDIPAQAGDRALLAFAKQAKVELLFSHDALRGIRTNAVNGDLEPAVALELMLRGTGFAARQTGNARWVITPTGPPAAQIKGRILAPDGTPARRVRVSLLPDMRTTDSGADGEYSFVNVPPGPHSLYVDAAPWRPLQINVDLDPGETLQLRPYALQRPEDPTRLEPFVVQGRSTTAASLDHSEAHLGRRVAGGNLDLVRTESDALPYIIFNRSQITRSGVVNLNEFLQRELIDSAAGALPPEQNGAADTFMVGSSNLSLRGYKHEETVILVNGRRLPEVLTSLDDEARPPDVNFIPLSLVQQVEVLPVSASSLYSGNAVGGVINIVLRPGVDSNASEITATYTNALAGYDAPQSSLSLLHAQSLLDGALNVRLNATFSQATPATEQELGYRQRRRRTTPGIEEPLFGATPNLRSIRPIILPRSPDMNEDVAGTHPVSAPQTEPPLAPLPPLFGPGTSSVTSVPRGANGSGEIASFRGREGMRMFDFFDSAGSFSTSTESLDFPYGREQQRATYYGSAVFDATPWLQLALDGTYSETVFHRGYDVMQGDLTLKASSPFNPFGQDVLVFVNETAPRLGEDYNEARLTFGSAVLSALLRLPSDWRVVLDSQYAHNLVKYRGLVGASKERWQKLVDDGLYNPLRDTQVFGPPPEFYDRVLIYRRAPGRFVTVGNYNTLDLAARIANESLSLPTGSSVINVGADYRRNQLGRYTDEKRYADGTLAGDTTRWGARTLDRYSFFGELQTPFYRRERLPPWLKDTTAHLGLRYVASSNSNEANYAPTFAGKFVLAGGVTLRGSVTTSTRFPTPKMNRPVVTPSTDGGTAGVNLETVRDYRRGAEEYGASVNELINPNLRPESAITQTAGLILQRGSVHRIRAALDFVATQKVDELAFLDRQQVTLHELLWPERVERAAPRPGEALPGRIVRVWTGRTNLAQRRSENATLSFDYRWTGFAGGALETYTRLLYFHRYRVQTLPNSRWSDELEDPQGIAPILRYRSNFGLSWSRKSYGFGADGHYFHARKLAREEWAAQGRDHIRPFWQFDAFIHADLLQLLPRKPSRFGLRAQLRVNNLFGTPYPKYVNDAYNAGVQPYGDWRGRVYSVSISALF